MIIVFEEPQFSLNDGYYIPTDDELAEILDNYSECEELIEFETKRLQGGTE